MTLARRVWLASVSLAFIVVAAFAALILAISAQRDATAREARSADVTAASLRLEKLVVDMETGIRGLTLTGEESFLEPYTNAVKALPARRAALQALVADDAVQRRRAQQVEESIREYLEFAGPLVKLVKETPSIGGEELVAEEGKRLTDNIQDVFDRLLKAEDSLAADAGRDAERRSRLAVIVGAIGIGASSALIILFGVFLARSIGRPVRAVASGASRLAGGEWSLRLPLQGAGEIGDLTRAFNEMAERIEQNHVELEQQNEELRESERMKTELVSIVSHELRTPLASVLGFTALLLKREFDPPIRRHYLGIVDAQARRLASLLEDFLDVQRIEHQGL
jgi:CHASE3 domain sensor protein